MFDPKTRFTRRAFFLSGAQGLLGAGLLGRLYWLQIESNQHYQKLSDKNRLHSEFILPVRGQIFDRDGRLLAGNRFVHRAILQRDQTKDWKQSLAHFGNFLSMTSANIQDILNEYAKKNKFIPIPLKDPLTWEEVAKIELHAADLPGIRVDQGQERFYPYAEDVCHLLGYVGKPSELETEENADLLLQHPGFRLGKAGIEKQYEGLLQGSPGIVQVEVNATRQVVREVSSHEPCNGQDLTLSVNLDLQQRITERLKGFESATAVVMNVNSGALLAAVSVPGFDTNHFTSGIPKNIWDDLRSNQYTPLVTKFTQGQYAPGSTFKMMVALAGLHSKAIDERTMLYCPGYYDLNNHRFHCVKHSGHGHVAMQQALAQSCDVYFYELSLRMGVDAIAAMAKIFGLGEKTLLQFPNEKAGLIPNKSWKERIQGKKWTPSETINTSIGQGYVLTTPLQLCIMTARLASKGKCIHPYLTEASRTFDSLVIDPKHMELVFNGMRDVMSSPHGTAYASRSPLDGIEFAGKTGTSQVRRITMRDRELKTHHNWPWRWRDHALFIGFAPVNDPKFAVSIVIEHGGWGGKVAAPIGRDILVDALKLVTL
ncbi:MAG: penicillin-binding protein 2 [Alphaproteobacteria bacterium]|nr:penicillin-binding protein 2 [Alphaproteobacteria bacterium]